MTLVYKTFGYSFYAYKVAHLGILLFLVASVLILIPSISNIWISILAIMIALTNESFLTSLLQFKWHVWSLLSFSAAYKFVEHSRTNKLNKAAMIDMPILLFSIFVYHGNFLYLTIASLCLAWIFRKQRVMWGGVAGASAIIFGIYWGGGFDSIISRITVSWNYRIGGGDWMQHLAGVWEKSAWAVNWYFSAWTLVAILFGAAVFVRSSQHGVVKVYCVLSFLSAALITFLVEGIGNYDWHLWLWGAGILFIIAFWRSVFEQAFFLTKRLLPGRKGVIVAYGFIAIFATSMEVFQVRRTESILTQSGYNPSILYDQTEVQLAAIVFRFLSENPSATVGIPFPNTPEVEGGFQMGQMQQFVEFQAYLKQGKIQYFPANNFATPLEGSRVDFLSRAIVNPPPQFTLGPVPNVNLMNQPMVYSRHRRSDEN